MRAMATSFAAGKLTQGIDHELRLRRFFAGDNHVDATIPAGSKHQTFTLMSVSTSKLACPAV